jgi:hypothetical protein
LKSNRIIILIVVSLLVVLFGWQWVIELRAEEPRRAIVSIEMWLTGDYLVPHINGWTYYNKPPVFNWLMASFFSIFGSMDEWVVRMPSLLSFLVLGWINFKLLKPKLGKEVALLSSLFFLTSADILLYGSVNSGEIDLFYSLVVYLQAMVVFIYGEKKQFLKMFLLSYLLAAIGFLTKGLPSLAFQALTLLAYAIYIKRFWLLLGWKHILGMLFFVAICFAYFYPYGQQDDVIGFLVRQFKEASQRTGLETKASDTISQTLSFPLQIAKLLLPWSLLLLFFFKKGFIQKIRSNRLLSFSVLFILVNIPLYWFSGDFKARYLYMFLPFLCTLLAYFFLQHRNELPIISKIVNRIFDSLVIILPLGFISFLFIPETSSLYLSGVRVVVVFLLGVGIAYLRFKSSQKIYSIVLLMILARLALNLFYLPALQEDKNAMYYKDALAEVLEITKEEPIFLYGKVYEFNSDASIGPLTFDEVKLRTAPLHAYQISYYITKNNKQVFHFDEEIKLGRFYIGVKEEVSNKGYQILHTFDDKWQKQKLVLFKS